MWIKKKKTKLILFSVYFLFNFLFFRFCSGRWSAKSWHKFSYGRTDGSPVLNVSFIIRKRELKKLKNCRRMLLHWVFFPKKLKKSGKGETSLRRTCAQYLDVYFCDDCPDENNRLYFITRHKSQKLSRKVNTREKKWESQSFNLLVLRRFLKLEKVFFGKDNFQFLK